MLPRSDVTSTPEQADAVSHCDVFVLQVSTLAAPSTFQMVGLDRVMNSFSDWESKSPDCSIVRAAWRVVAAPQIGTAMCVCSGAGQPPQVSQRRACVSVRVATSSPLHSHPEPEASQEVRVAPASCRIAAAYVATSRMTASLVGAIVTKNRAVRVQRGCECVCRCGAGLELCANEVCRLMAGVRGND